MTVLAEKCIVTLAEINSKLLCTENTTKGTQIYILCGTERYSIIEGVGRDLEDHIVQPFATATI